MDDLFRLWLATVGVSVPDSEMRVNWNVKDDPTPVLDAALGDADYFYVGSWSWEHEGQEPQSGKCPARRVFDWLFWRGTVNGYGVPTLNDQLVEELLRCFEPRAGDLPASTADAGEFRAFLVGHRGLGVVPEEHAPAVP